MNKLQRVKQEKDWTCCLSAFRAVLLYYNVDIKESRLENMLKQLQLRVFSWGIYMSYLALLAKELELKTIVHIGRTSLSSIGLVQGRDPIRLRTMLTTRKREFLEDTEEYHLLSTLLLLLEKDIPIKTYSRSTKPDLSTIRSIIKKKRPMVVRVTCAEFYGIKDEDWAHFIALVPTGNGFDYIDPYQSLFQKDYNTLWRAQRKQAFNWGMWSGDMLEFYEARALN
jgi:hypothetical protein